jgi:hypothetical protein
MNLKVLRRALIFMALTMALSACAAAGGEALPLVSYEDPLGRFTFAIPEGWEAAADDTLLTITPEGYSGSAEELRVMVYFAPTNTQDTAEHLEKAKTLMENFLSQYLDEDYQSYNEGDTKVDRLPSALLDFAKPYQDSFLVGRVVFVVLPSQALVFLGTGPRAEWENFLPTFRAMLEEFHLTGQEVTPTLRSPDL